VTTDQALFLHINGLAGKVPIIDGFFRGISNDYFAVISCCLILIWLWFGTRGDERRQVYQRTVLIAAISIGLASLLMLIVNQYYFRPRPFNELPPGSVNLLFYRPTDSSFPSNLAAVLFAIAVPIIIKIRSYGLILLAIAVFSSFGRIYIGIHYPLDVLGGAAIGALGALLAYGTAWLIAPLMNLIMSLLRKLYLA
jgi:undecaprenyl-diphosphatase